MRKLTAAMLLAFCLLSALPVAPQVGAQRTPAAAPRQTPTPSAAPSPQVQFFDVVTLARSSARQDAEGSPLPPWTKVELDALEFKTRPAVGASLTVVPLGVKLPPLELKIKKVAREMNQCTARNFWQADLEPITRRDFRDAAPLPERRPDAPFDVLVIYPAVKTYKLLEASALAARTLPRGVTPKVVRAAVDLDGDAAPELLYVHGCCDDFSKPPQQCDYECSKTFQKTRGVWKLTNTHEPC